MNKVVYMSQVHGSRIAVVTAKDSGKTITDCDGLITSDKDISLCVKVADCLPVIIKDPIKNVLGIFHAGWRGLDKKILLKGLEIFINNFSSNPKNLDVEIGPHICGSHYEIKQDVAVKFKNYKSGVISKNRKIYLDLAEVAKEQLIVKGIPARNIKVDKKCTFETETLHSYRKTRTGKRNTYYYYLK